MSRCYPYLSNGEAVSQTIKSDLNKPLTDKLKKEKRSKIQHKKSTSHSKLLSKRKDDDEPGRSSLTEEHGRPVCHHTLSSDSTRSRHKRKREEKRGKSEKKLFKAEVLYKTLFGDWTAPPVVYHQTNFDDQSWLSATKTQDIRCDKRIKIYQHDEPGDEASSFWPCARNLPQADIYALPYTISF
ncbi:uncharacterized protein LOC126661505 [Mercurialis annua]|uniref:uncharacterized protein LOC126661505 n=1 Tax=Mercurialis annua TaxID=3986 RepID=UPI00215F558A|nr:uncharacterized protein LOC126661505 [Mercurialis annua]